MGVVSVRLEDEDEKYLRKHRKNISELTRDAMHQEVLRMRLEEEERFFAGVRKKPSQSSEKTIREMRESRYGK